MSLRFKTRASSPRVLLAAAFCTLFATAIAVLSLFASDQPASDSVGAIEGDDISVTGPMNVEVVGTRTKTILRSGSDVRVNSGQARLRLMEGGEVIVCGPAHFSVLKSGGALTFALESGVMHAILEHEPTLMVYTAQIQAQPVAIGDDPRELLVGFESPTTMCIRTERGALRLEEQLTGQSVIVPQGGDVLLSNGRIDSLTNGGGHCQCESEFAQEAPLPPPPPLVVPAPAPDVAESARSSSAAPSSAPIVAAEKPATKDETIYEVTMPPLVYDASAKVQPEPDLQLMTIVKRVRVRSELVFRGRVELAPVHAPSATATPPPAAPKAPAAKPAEPTEGSVVGRVRSFFHHLWSKSG